MALSVCPEYPGAGLGENSPGSELLGQWEQRQELLLQPREGLGVLPKAPIKILRVSGLRMVYLKCVLREGRASEQAEWK